VKVGNLCRHNGKTGRAVGKAAAVVAEVPSLLTSAVEKVVDVVTPTPARKRAARAR